MKNLVLGIDVGGTNIKFGIVDTKGRVLARTALATKSYDRDKNGLIAAMLAKTQELAARARISLQHLAGIGIGLPGLIDPMKGVVIFLPNVTGWKNVALKRIFEKKFGVPTFLENDVNMITLGEWQFGAGRGYQNLVCITLGTGVGGGLILNGQLYRGQGFVAGEIGHMPLNEHGPACSCGGRGCFERYVGNATLEANIRKILKKDLRIPDVYQLALKKDPRALRFFEEAAAHIGQGLIGVVNLLNPPLVVIGGGVSNNARFLFPTVKKILKTRCMKVQAKMVRVVRARFSDQAGILGAAVLVRQGLK